MITLFGCAQSFLLYQTEVLYVTMSLHCICMLGNFLGLCWRLLTFFKIIFSKLSFINTIRVSKNLVPDKDRPSIDPDMSPNFLQRLSED